MPQTPARPLLPGFAAVILLTFSTTVAEAGTPWIADDELVELSGTLTELYVGQPQPVLALETGSDQWLVDLAALSVGLDIDHPGFSVGDTITVIGYRATDPDWLALQAVRVTADPHLTLVE